MAMNMARRSRHTAGMTICLVATSVLFSAALHSQSAGSAAPPAAPPQTQPATPPIFKLRSERNLVLVQVVVRDSHDHPVGNLTKDDFRVFDNGKPETVSIFSVERSETPSAAPAEAPAPASAASASAVSPSSVTRPQRFLAIFIDDVHLKITDLMDVRGAVEKYLSKQFSPGLRIGLFTASSANEVGFTSNPATIEKALGKLFPRGVSAASPFTCMQMPAYEAYEIVDKDDQIANQVATQEYIKCYCPPRDNSCITAAPDSARARAVRVLSVDESQSETSLQGILNVIHQIAGYPGQRIVAVVSPGFLGQPLRFEYSTVADAALRADVVINALDARGLYTEIPGGSIEHPDVTLMDTPMYQGEKESLRMEGNEQMASPLANLAYDTGGRFIQNTNDLAGGLEQISGLPRVYYLLAYSPKRFRHNGAYHKIRVALTIHAHYQIQARRGYYAPRSRPTTASETQVEIRSALFSQQNVTEFPIVVSTQFYRPKPGDAKLAVLASVNPVSFKFQRHGGRNLDQVKFVAAVFNDNGKYLSAVQKELDFHMLDESLAALSKKGFTVPIVFTLKPGSYMVREVVLDSGSGKICGVTRSVTIPQ